jgi:pyruvate kinase
MMWQRMLAVGVTAFRLNTSHLTSVELATWVRRLGVLLGGRTPRPALVLDLQGSKWRLGDCVPSKLAEGQRVEFACAPVAPRAGVLPVPHPDFFRAARVSSGEIVLDDAKLRLAVESYTDDTLLARVVVGGPLLPRKGITYTASTYRQESLTEADRAILERTREAPGIRYALSYVKDAAEMASYRRQIGSGTYLIAKLERQPAVDEAAMVAAHCDEVWLCRGDLGAELGLAAMAEAVGRFSDGVGALPVPALLAGQVFEHMTEHAAPTRSEVCAVHDALRRGYRGLVLSDETAIGRDPLEACRMAALFRG